MKVKNFKSWLNKKGLTTDMLVVILLVVGLAIAVILFISFAGATETHLCLKFPSTCNVNKGPEVPL